MSGGVEVRVTQAIAASPESVFDAWLDPGLIGRWMFGAALRDEEVLRLSNDPRVGGKFSFLVRRLGVEIDHVGTYLELDRPRRAVFTWGIKDSSEDESTVTLDIVPRVAGAELTLTHEIPAKWAEYADRTQAGWAKMLGVLAATLTQPVRDEN